MIDQQLEQFKKDTQDALTKLKGQVDNQDLIISTFKSQLEKLPIKPSLQSFETIKFFESLRVGNLYTLKNWSDVSSSRAKDTTYTNGVYSILVMATFRCIVTTLGGNAYVQAKSDDTTPPTTVASGKTGIEVGLLNEDASVQIVFVVAPGKKYRIDSSATNGTVTLGKWVEIPF